MDTDSSISAWLVLARAVHFAACLLALAACAFDRLIVAPAIPPPLADAPRWRRIFAALILIAWPLALLSGAVWFAFVAIDMTGLSLADVLHGDVLGVVWSRTRFGDLWQLRLGFWLAGIPTMALLLWLPRFRPTLVWIMGLIAALLVASLAWAGHGQMAPAVPWHLAADVLHLLICALWPVGLLPFFLFLWYSPQPDSRLARRFSTLSAASVVTLALTGLVNALILVRTPANLIRTPYGRVLSLKIALFFVMILLGAFNRFYLLPRLAPPRGNAATSLRRSVFMELFLAAAVLLIVGYLGRLAPPAHLMHMNMPMP